VGNREAARAALVTSERGRAHALLDLMRKSAGDAGFPVPTPGADMAAEGEALALRATRNSTAAISYMVTPDTLLAWLLLPRGD
jgi:hypothetical protein